jgi:hypothetical protein
MYDDALKRKMAQEFSGIEQTTFWNEYQKAIKAYRVYNSLTLEVETKEWEIARAQGAISAIGKIRRIPLALTGLEKAPDDKE